MDKWIVRYSIVSSLLIGLITSCNLPDRSLEPSEPSEQESRPNSLQTSPIVEFPNDLSTDPQIDPCIVGTWIMSTSYLDLLVANLVPVPNIRVPEGSLDITFEDYGQLSYGGDLTIQIEFNAAENWYLQGLARFSTTALYTTVENNLRVQDQVAESEVYEWRAYHGGQSSIQPGGGPQINLTLPDSAPYRCTDTLLELDTVNPSGTTITMFFSK